MISTLKGILITDHKGFGVVELIIGIVIVGLILAIIPAVTYLHIVNYITPKALESNQHRYGYIHRDFDSHRNPYYKEY